MAAVVGLTVLTFLLFAKTYPFINIIREVTAITISDFDGLANFSLIPVTFTDLTLGNATNAWSELYINDSIICTDCIELGVATTGQYIGRVDGIDPIDTTQTGLENSTENISIKLDPFFFGVNASGGLNITNIPLNVTLDEINAPGENRTLFVSGWSTGDVLNDQVDLFVGRDDYGVLGIGDSVQIAVIDGVGQIGSLNLSNVMLIRHFEDVALNNISLLFTSQNQVRLAIPIPGVDFATYNPRSQMIGGDLGQQNNNNIIRCSEQGYTFIDCDTSGTGADLGVQDDLEVRGSAFINLPHGNMWLHNDSTMGHETIISASDTWTNVSGFNQTDEANQTLSGVSFINGNALQVSTAGLYHVTYAMSYQKLTGAAINHEFKTIIFVGTTEQDSLETHRTMKEADAVGAVAGTAILDLAVNDYIYLTVQGVGNSIDIGTHAASVVLTRMGN